MPRIAKQLSDRAVAAIKAAGRHPVGGVPGLLLRVTETGHRGWVLRTTVGDKRRDLGLGSYPEVTLAEAREKARKSISAVRFGETLTPARATRAAASAANRTFKDCALDFLRDKSVEWKNAKHRWQWDQSLEGYVYPHIGGLPVALVDTPHVLACLEPIWRVKTETSTRVRGRIEAVLDWAAARKYRSGENPARWRGHLDKLLPNPSKVAKVEHYKALPIDAAPQFMVELQGRDGIAAKALEFLILTAARSGEVRGATWQEIDMQARIWNVPASRMKAGREHRVPLSDKAIKLLKGMPKIAGVEYVFPGSREKPLSDMSLLAIMRRMKVDAVPHGFRSTFRDWAGDRTHFPRDLIEQALAHAIANQVEAAYRRSDALEKRRELMQRWADYLDSLRVVSEVAT